MPGPRPKSAAERRATGNAGHKAKSKLVEPRAAVAAPALPGTAEASRESPLGTPPEFLSLAQKRTWELAAPALVKLNLLQRPDAIAFGRYCGWLTRYLDLEKATRRTKTVERTARKGGKMDRVDKGVLALLMVDKRLQEYEDRFGMNPRERQAIIARLAGQPAAPPPGPKPAEAGQVEPPALRAGPIGGLRGASRLQ